MPERDLATWRSSKAVLGHLPLAVVYEVASAALHVLAENRITSTLDDKVVELGLGRAPGAEGGSDAA
jgi:hypothetical protein